MNIGLGTAAIGRPQYINIRETLSNTEFNKLLFIQKGKEVLSEAYKNGVKHFDTAPGYGIAEQILLEWIEENKLQDITVSTKWGYTYVANFDPNASTHEVKEHTISKLNEQWQFSKQLLPYLNIYQIHSATLDSGVLTNNEVLHRLYELKTNHQIEIGLSTSGANQNAIIDRALAVKINDEELFDSFQVTYNVFDQSLAKIKEKLLGKKLIIKEALANGRIFPNDNYSNYKPIYETLKTIASKYNVGVDAVALRFCIDSINPYKVLSGASEKRHLVSNLESETIYLTKQDVLDIQSLAVKPKDYWEERKQLTWN